MNTIGFAAAVSIVVALMLNPVAAGAPGGKAKPGPCIRQCVQAFNPSRADTGVDEVLVTDLRMQDCVELCRELIPGADCYPWTDGCCSPDHAAIDPDCGQLPAGALCDSSDQCLSMVCDTPVGGGVGTCAEPGGAGYSGTYCLVLEEAGRIMSLQVELRQAGDTVGFSTTGIISTTGTGTMSGTTATLSGAFGPGGLLTLEMTFSEDGRALSGRYQVAAEGEVERGALVGRREACADYEAPRGDPACILPARDLALVTGARAFAPDDLVDPHSGIDLQYDTPSPAVAAPCAGVVTLISRHPIRFGNIAIDVNVTYNSRWNTYIVFEPYTADEATADMQEAQILVELNQVVMPGDLLGRLVVPGDTEFPHVHWGMSRSDSWDEVCPVAYVTADEREALEARFAELGAGLPCP